MTKQMAEEVTKSTDAIRKKKPSFGTIQWLNSEGKKGSVSK
jgi:hypothetical protein